MSTGRKRKARPSRGASKYEGKKWAEHSKMVGASRTGDGYERQCVTVDGTKKARFQNRESAKKYLRDRPHLRKELSIYRCPQCGFIHLGHKPTKGSRASSPSPRG